jgi:hypothetical protein
LDERPGVRRVPKQGGTARTLFATTRVTLASLALDAKNVYLSVPLRDVMVGQKTGGKSRPLARLGELAHPGALAVDDSSVYVLTAHDVVRIDKRSGNSAKIASGQGSPMGIALDRAWVYWSDRAGNERGQGAIRRARK